MRTPLPQDAAAVHSLVVRSGVLDANSPYCYLLLCSDFAATSLVAVTGEEQVVGFVAAYRRPASPETLFVWQIGVDAEVRGCGLGRRLLEQLLTLPGCDGVTHLEATVTPSNIASRRLLEGFARTRGLDCIFDASAGFPVTLFGDAGHEQEDRVRIGPLAAVGEAAGP